MLRLRHFGLLVRDVVAYLILSRRAWMLPIMLVLLVLGITAATTQAAVPYMVYTLF